MNYINSFLQVSFHTFLFLQLTKLNTHVKSLLKMSTSFMKPLVKSTSSFPYYFIKTLLLRKYHFNNNSGNI
jgi:hypothetical protein